MTAGSSGHSKQSKSASSSTLKAPVVTFPITVKDGTFVFGDPTVTGYTGPTNQVAIVAALSIPVLGQTLSKNHELTLRSNLRSVIYSRSITTPKMSDGSAEYVFHGFNGALDVLALYDPTQKLYKFGISSHKIANEVQFNAAISRGIGGQIATENCTLAIVIPTGIGNFSVDGSLSERAGSAPQGSANISWKHHF